MDYSIDVEDGAVNANTSTANQYNYGSWGGTRPYGFTAHDIFEWLVCDYFVECGYANNGYKGSIKIHKSLPPVDFYM
jgi:hypothetical protein